MENSQKSKSSHCFLIKSFRDIENGLEESRMNFAFEFAKLEFFEIRLRTKIGPKFDILKNRKIKKSNFNLD